MAQSDTESKAVRVDVTRDGAVTHTLGVAVEAKRVRRAFDRAYRDLGRQVKVRGFRPGKVPRSVLERLYGASIGEQIESTLVRETLGEAIQESGLQPVAEPVIDADPPQPDAEFCYRARVEVKPEFELPDTSGLPAERPAVDVADEEIEGELEKLRERQAPVIEEPEGTELGDGHRAVIDFAGRIDDEPFEGGTGEGVELEVGAGSFIPGFEEQLFGARAGESRVVRVRFPDDYGAEQLRGKEAEFAVDVLEVKRRQLPDLDDEFAKDVGDFDTIEALRTRIRDDLTASREKQAQVALRRSLMDALIERAPFEVPPGMVDRALERQLESARRRFEGQLDPALLARQVDRWRYEWRDEAEREVREQLLLEAVAKEQGITAEEPEVELRIEQMAQEQGVDSARFRQAFSGVELQHAVASQVVDEKALDYLIGEAKVEETTDT